jgi:hypothetical protein
MPEGGEGRRTRFRLTFEGASIMRIPGRTRWFALVLMTLGLVLVLAAPALAQGGRSGTLVVLRGSIDVPAGETAATVVIFDGPVTIEGTVTGSVVAFHGPVTVSGSVRGSVISASNRVVLLDGAEVGGDVKSQKAAVISPSATVGGSVGTVDYSQFDDFARVSRYLWWFGVTVSTFVLGLFVLLLPAGVTTAIQGAASRVGPSFGWGALAFFGLPIATIVLLAIVITIPLGLALLFALGLLYLAGYVAAAWVLGGRVARNSSRFVTYVVGWGILRAVALVPILAGLAWTVGSLFGLGVLALAIWSRPSSVPETVAVPAVPAVPPPPPPPPA